MKIHISPIDKNANTPAPFQYFCNASNNYPSFCHLSSLTHRWLPPHPPGYRTDHCVRRKGLQLNINVTGNKLLAPLWLYTLGTIMRIRFVAVIYSGLYIVDWHQVLLISLWSRSRLEWGRYARFLLRRLPAESEQPDKHSNIRARIRITITWT